MDLACHRGSEFATVARVIDAGKSKQFIGTKTWQFEVRRINVKTSQVGRREERGIDSRLPIAQRDCGTEGRMGGIVCRADVGAGNNFFSVVDKDEALGGDVALRFSNTNLGITLFRVSERTDAASA
jgi:hypothetical protein